MSFRVITKCFIFGNNSKEESTLNRSKNTDLKLNNFCNQEKRVTISEYMNHKIDDPDIAIENLKKDLEKNIIKYHQ
jgi:hypothetical protein